MIIVPVKINYCPTRIPDERVSSQTIGFPNILNQQGAGTRQTVYYNNNESSSSSKTDVPESPKKDEPSANPPTFLVYNRVNTVLGGDVGVHNKPPSPNNSIRSHRSQSGTMSHKLSPPPPPPPPPTSSDDSKRKSRKENSIWFEYGCV